MFHRLRKYLVANAHYNVWTNLQLLFSEVLAVWYMSVLFDALTLLWIQVQFDNHQTIFSYQLNSNKEIVSQVQWQQYSQWIHIVFYLTMWLQKSFILPSCEAAYTYFPMQAIDYGKGILCKAFHSYFLFLIKCWTMV